MLPCRWVQGVRTGAKQSGKQHCSLLPSAGGRGKRSAQKALHPAGYTVCSSGLARSVNRRVCYEAKLSSRQISL